MSLLGQEDLLAPPLEQSLLLTAGKQIIHLCQPEAVGGGIRLIGAAVAGLP